MIILASIGKSIVGCLIGAVAMPVILLIISILVPNITLYQGKPLPILTYIDWLLFLDPNSYSNVYNIFGVFAAWIFVWFIVGNWSGKMLNAITSPIFTLLLYMATLILYYRISPEFSNYLMWTVIISGLVSSSVGSLSTRLRPRKTFFQRLAEGGIHVDPKYTKNVSLPVVCPKCGVSIFSNAKYCWNCATNLEELVY